MLNLSCGEHASGLACSMGDVGFLSDISNGESVPCLCLVLPSLAKFGEVFFCCLDEGDDSSRVLESLHTAQRDELQRVILSCRRATFFKWRLVIWIGGVNGC